MRKLYAMAIIFFLINFEISSITFGDNIDKFEKFLMIDGKLKTENNIFIKDEKFRRIEKISSLIKELYLVSNNKENLQSDLREIFKKCALNEQTNDICSFIIDSILGRDFILSNIKFKNVFLSFKNKIYYRDNTEFNEHYSLLSHNDISPINEFSVGNYLFGIVVGNSSYDNKYNAIRILKAGDTHRQEFVKISTQTPNNYEIYSKGKIINNKLHLFIPINVDNNLYKKIVSEYELQSNSDRKLVGCYENYYSDSYAFNSIEEKKLPIAICKDLNNSIETTLGKGDKNINGDNQNINKILILYHLLYWYINFPFVQ